MSVRLALCFALLAAPARAQSFEAPSARPLHSFFPSAEARRAEREQVAQAASEQALRALPHVQAANVAIRLPAGDDAPLDQPLPAPRALVVLSLTGPGPSRERVLQIVRSQVPTLDGAALYIESRVSPARPAAQLARVGPFLVEAGSAPALRGVLAACLASNALLALLVLGRLRRRRML